MNDILEKALEYEETYNVVGRAHYLAADRYADLNRAFGIPVIVITAAIGTTIFSSLDQNPNVTWKIVAGLISLAGTVLSSLQTSLGFAQTAEKHKAGGEAYRALRRWFEMFRLRYAHATDRKAAMDDLQKIVDDLAEIPQNFPTIPEACYKRAKDERAAKKASREGDAHRTVGAVKRQDAPSNRDDIAK